LQPNFAKMEDNANDMIIIPTKGLTPGEHTFSFAVGEKFFQSFGNSQIKDADCSVRVELVKQQTLMEVVCRIGGFVVVECDRCLEDLTIKVDVEQSLTVGFGAVELDDDEDVVVVSPEDGSVSLDQFVYDYICLSLPLIKVHPEGKCNPEMIRRLTGSADEGGNTPFSALKDMIDNKTK